MKKSTLIVIGIIYIASIVLISVFGMKAVVWDVVTPVTAIECLNESDDKSDVSINSDGNKLIKIKFEEPGKLENGVPTGTMLQLYWRVLPDDATTKTIKFVYNTELTRANFIKNDDGTELGLILFSGKIKLDLSIMSTDGTKIAENIVIWVY